MPLSERFNHYHCVKYFLMASNAFGIMLGIFIVLFGLAYSVETFPGGFKGRTCAIASVVFIFFALIGYCGAHHQKVYFLIVYSAIIFLFVTCNSLIWIIAPQNSLLDSHSKTVIAMGLLFIGLMLAAIVLSWHLKYTDQMMIEEQQLNEKTFINRPEIVTFNSFPRPTMRSYPVPSYWVKPPLQSNERMIFLEQYPACSFLGAFPGKFYQCRNFCDFFHKCVTRFRDLLVLAISICSWKLVRVPKYTVKWRNIL